MKSHSLSLWAHRKNSRLSSLTRLLLLISLIAVIGVSLLLNSSASTATSTANAEHPGNLPAKATALVPLPLSNLGLAQETIQTFASDCTTPQTSFVLGETVCAKTDNVDLNFPGGRWVHWLRSDLSIAFGGSGVTDITSNPQTFTYVPDQTGTWKVTIAETGDISQTPAIFTVTAPQPLATYQADCVTPKSSFSLGETVCAKLVGAPAIRSRLAILNTAGFTLAVTDVTTNPQTLSFTLPTAESEFFGDQNVDNRGTWSVNQIDSSDATVRTAIDFIVTDPNQDVADISTSSILVSGGDVTPGSDAVFDLFVVNKGPNAAANVQLVDTVPTNTTFGSLVQTGGPTFNCTTPAAGNTGTTTCTLASLPNGAVASFTFTYRVDAGVTAGTTIQHTTNVTSDTADSNTLDNTSTAGSDVPVGTGAEPCILSCRENLTITANTTQGGVDGAFVNFTSVDQNSGNCGALTTNPVPGSFFPVGTNPVNVTSELNEGSCSFNVIVTTIAAPTISCPADITVNVASGETSATVTPGTPSTVPTSGVTVTFARSDDDDDPETPPLPLTAPFQLGVTNITWTVRDASDRTATCQQRIVVQEETRPFITISCPANINATATSCEAGATVSLGTPTTVPSDSNVEVTATRSDGAALTDPFPVGNTDVVWKATDNVNGNVATCTQVVHVSAANDTTPPTLHVPGPIVTSTSSCSVVLDDELGVATAEDNCSAVSISRTGVPANFRFPTGTTTITYTATDASGNSTTATQTVTVHESPAIAPVISCPTDITVFLPVNSTATSMPVNFPAPTATDNCSTPTVTTSVASGSIFPVGTTTVTVTATDADGNHSTCQFNVTVLYNFSGFFEPVDNLPTLNVVNAGKAIPVKFTLSGNKGLNIFAANSPFSVTISCDGSAPQSDIEETVNAGGSSLNYTASTDQYNYVWKTENSWKNTCRQLILRLNDGTEHRANFKFK